jgi:hypothetical protein
MTLAELANAINKLCLIADTELVVYMYRPEMGHMSIENVGLVIDNNGDISLVINAQ